LAVRGREEGATVTADREGATKDTAEAHLLLLYLLYVDYDWQDAAAKGCVGGGGWRVKGWLAGSDGEARFAWTGLRDAARPVGGGEGGWGCHLQMLNNTTKQRTQCRSGCTAAMECLKPAEAGCGCEMQRQNGEAGKKRLLEWLRKEKDAWPKASVCSLSWELASGLVRALM